MKTIHVRGYRNVIATLRERHLAQALYDEGGVVMADVLLTLHGEAHKDRRRLENRVFRRAVFHEYEREIFPPTIGRTLAPFVVAGGGDLIEIGYRITMNLTADFAGIDRPQQTAEETEALLALVRKFSEGATLVHSTRDKDVVRAEVKEALATFERSFLAPSIARRRRLLDELERGALSEQALPRDVLTVLLRNEERLPLPDDVLKREIAFYLQAGAHSTANAASHALHEIFRFRTVHPEHVARLDGDRLFLQRCVHESLRLHPASPVAWRKATRALVLPNGDALEPGDRVIAELAEANRDPEVFGADADAFDPHRELPADVMPWGLSFGRGPHACPGQDLDGGLVPGPDTDPAEHLYGSVTSIVATLLEHGAGPDPTEAPTRDARTERPNWGRYPIVFALEGRGAVGQERSAA